MGRFRAWFLRAGVWAAVTLAHLIFSSSAINILAPNVARDLVPRSPNVARDLPPCSSCVGKDFRPIKRSRSADFANFKMVERSTAITILAPDTARGVRWRSLSADFASDPNIGRTLRLRSLSGDFPSDGLDSDTNDIVVEDNGSILDPDLRHRRSPRDAVTSETMSLRPGSEIRVPVAPNNSLDDEDSDDEDDILSREKQVRFWIFIVVIYCIYRLSVPDTATD